MSRNKAAVPSLRRHSRLGQGVVRLNGKDFWCGAWPEGQAVPPPAVRAKYDRVIREWLARGRCPAVTKAVAQAEPVYPAAGPNGGDAAPRRSPPAY